MSFRNPECSLDISNCSHMSANCMAISSQILSISKVRSWSAHILKSITPSSLSVSSELDCTTNLFGFLWFSHSHVLWVFPLCHTHFSHHAHHVFTQAVIRSEERRVGKEC